jgi:hypothetical protein
MATLKNLKPGQIVWSLEWGKAGNTTMREQRLYSIKVESIDLEKETAIASWNSNPPRLFRLNSIKKWRVNKPKPKGENAFGNPIY